MTPLQNVDIPDYDELRLSFEDGEILVIAQVSMDK